MPRSFARRGVLGAAAAVGGAALLAPLAPAAAAVPTTRAPWPTSFPLPRGFRPEGIAIGTSPYAYFGSLADGSVHRVALATGRGRTVAPPLGPEHNVVGLKIDRRERQLFLCGGWNREIRIVDAATGAPLAAYTGLGTADTGINDVVLTPGAAWFTDSFNPHVFRLPLDRHDEPTGPVETVALTGDWEQGPAFTTNGISRTPDGRSLLLANNVVDGGGLVRMDPRTGRCRRVDLAGLRLPFADGLLLLGRLLYVVQQQLNTVNVLRLDDAGTRGTEVDRITDVRFRIPTTAAAYGNRIYLPNARFDVAPTPDTEYDAVAVRRVRG
ncbi:superoxide dismutase [Streptomyces sp. NPDC020412]|uniref:superoxide dismutase n=1 Tax=Streptomyces sp. NPDC020412 TaxID=3365073 RepID=UPI00378A9EB4